MINRRTPRPSRAVENLQQFCLNNSAGIDCTAPHSNVKNIYDSTNLIPNSDGSLSLRKPLLIKRDWSRLVRAYLGADYTFLNIFPLYLENVYLLCAKHTQNESVVCAIYDGTSVVQKYTLVWTDKDGVLRERDCSWETSLWDPNDGGLVKDLNNAITFHTSSSTVLGNCNVGLNSAQLICQVENSWEQFPMTDVQLYPEHDAKTVLYKPRFIKVYRNYLYEWFFEIHNPETNVLEMDSKTGTYEHPMNTILDDMYTLQDTYGSVPVVKQIVPYTYTKRFGDRVVPIEYASDVENIDVPQFRNGTQTFGTRVVYLTDLFATKELSSSTTTDAGTVDHTLSLSSSISYFDHPSDFTKRHLTVTLKAESTVTFTASRDLDSLTLTRKPLQIDASLNANGASSQGVVRLAEASITYKSIKKGESKTLFRSADNGVGTRYGTNELSVKEFKTTTSGGDVSYSASYKTTVSVPVSPNRDHFNKTVGDVKFRGVTAFPTVIPDDVSVYLKAFCNFPNPNSDIQFYATWLYTLNGINWLNALEMPTSEGSSDNYFQGSLKISSNETPIKGVDTGDSEDNCECIYAPLFKTDGGLNSVDILKITQKFLQEDFTNASFRFKIVSIQNGQIVGLYGQVDYVPLFFKDGEYWYSDFGNSVLGEKLYHKSRIFSFGDPIFKNNIFVSEPGEFVIPFKNTIDISSSEDSVVTSITPWKDYLFVSTPQALYLVTQVESGWITKTANAALGVSQTDAKCVVAALNGVIFKSGTKVYMFYPNIYAGDDSVINVTDISSPIEHLLEGFDNASGAFAFGTDSEYVLMLPKIQGTLCLSYNYNTRVWTKTEYPVQFTKHIVNNLTDIVLFGQNSEGAFCEYYYNKTFAEAYGNDVGAPYGDVLVESKNGILQDVMSYGTTNSTLKISPITFGLDTGQKAEAIVTTKQFVETKFVLATLDKADAFPMQLTVHIDGDPHIITRDISTDAAFWKDSSAKGVLNTTFSGLSDKSDTFNVLRQLIVRYSGKGKSIRHILEGQSLSNFKLYETYIRYKLLNVKQ